MTFPYFEQPHLGPFHAFGALVAMAVLVGTTVLQKRAIHEKLDPELASRLVFWVLVGGFIGAHLVHVFVYYPSETFKNPITILKIWEGISSFGGFCGAITAIFLFTRRPEFQALDTPTRWRHIDVVAYAFVMGWIFGRAGCTVAFDHPGTPTTFFLGFTDRAGVVRHNLGFYEMLYFALVLAPLFYLVGRKVRGHGPGFYAGLVAVAYPPVRFALEFYRTVDVRYGGLTPAQWGSFAAVAAGLATIAYSRKLSALEAELAAAPAASTPSSASSSGPRSGKKNKRGK